jgi:hypothetical protein
LSDDDANRTALYVPRSDRSGVIRATSSGGADPSEFLAFQDEDGRIFLAYPDAAMSDWGDRGLGRAIAPLPCPISR